jgi:hypothetical protein
VVLVTATVLDESSSSHLGLFRGCEEAVGGCLELEFSAAASRMCRMLLARVIRRVDWVFAPPHYSQSVAG